MKKRVVKLVDLPSAGVVPVLVILSIAFLVGGLAGCVLTNWSIGDGSAALKEYLAGYVDAARAGELDRPEWIAVFWDQLKWPLLVFILGLTPVGLLGIPVLFLAQGFLMAFSAAAFFRVYGFLGLSMAFVIFGVTGLLSLPVLFLLGVQGFLCSGMLAGQMSGEGRRKTLFSRAFVLRCAGCAAVLCVCSVLELYWIPGLLGAFSGAFL